MRARYPIAAMVLGLLLAGGAIRAAAQSYDPITITPIETGHAKAVLRVQAGPSGAPAGFTIWWMKRVDFSALGESWPGGQVAGKRWAAYVGTPTLNDGEGLFDSFMLGPNESIDIEVGDLIDETGLYTNATPNAELTFGDEYVFTGFANANVSVGQSALTPTTSSCTRPVTDCTYTIGYWKNHPSEWPTGSLTLGTVTYTKTQLLSILSTPARGNGLVSLAHQLIATKLNVLHGASVTTISAAIASADALIGGLVPPSVGLGSLKPSKTSSLTQTLDDFNNGISGPGHCGDTTPATTSTWGELKTRYR
jgi:hypothetical protein